MKTQLSQKDRILRRLNLGQLCSVEPLAWEPPITRVAARIYDLSQDGYEIEARQSCGLHHRPAAHACYRLVTQDQETLF